MNYAYKIIRYIIILLYRIFYSVKNISLAFLSRKKVFILNTPIHGNLGDQAILMSEELIIKDVLPQHKIIEVPNDFCRHNKFLLRCMVSESPIFIHGGGYLGDLWPREDKTIKQLLILFKNNKIMFFPQTFCSHDNDAYFNSMRSVYNANKRLSLFARDKYTYDVLTHNIDNKIYYSPDIVLYGKDVNYKKDDSIMLCLRNDHEKSLSDETKSEILSSIGEYQYDVIDTVVDKTILPYNREKEISKIMNKIGRSRLLVTDRLHGMIFAYLTKTPCLVFNSKSPKVLGVYKWISGADYIFLHNEKNDIKDEIYSIYNGNYSYKHCIPRSCFKEMKKAIMELYDIDK